VLHINHDLPKEQSELNSKGRRVISALHFATP
jgi:hypothetical protein